MMKKTMIWKKNWKISPPILIQKKEVNILNWINIPCLSHKYDNMLYIHIISKLECLWLKEKNYIDLDANSVLCIEHAAFVDPLMEFLWCYGGENGYLCVVFSIQLLFHCCRQKKCSKFSSSVFSSIHL